jgi:hypothetical protein
LPRRLPPWQAANQENQSPVYDGPEGQSPVYDGPEGQSPVYDGPEGQSPVYDGPEGQSPVYDGPESKFARNIWRAEPITAHGRSTRRGAHRAPE